MLNLLLLLLRFIKQLNYYSMEFLIKILAALGIVVDEAEGF